MAKYIVQKGQSIYDIAVEIYGDIMGIGSILQDNPNINLDTFLEEGSSLEINQNSENIFSVNIANYFRNKSIVNSESEAITKELNELTSYGELITQNLSGEEYINSVMWGNNSVNLSNTGLLLDEYNFDRIHFLDTIDLDVNGSFFEIDFVYNDIGVDQFIAGSNNGSSVRIEDGKISLYSSGEEFELTHSFELQDKIKYRLKCECLINGDIKSFGVSIDGHFQESTPSIGEVNLSLIGGEDGSRGYEGTISYLNINNSVFNFSEENGIYVYKSSK